MREGTGGRRKRKATAEEFRLLLKRLDPLEDRAWEIHDALRRKLIWFFESEFPLQAEELAEEALDRIARKLNSSEIRDVAEFAFGVARNLRRETSRHALIAARLAASGAISDSVQSGENPEQAAISRIDFDRKLACLKKCLLRLDAEERRLLSLYYPDDGSNLEERREALARELKISLGTLRTRIARLREQLEKCFENCEASRPPGS